MDEINERRFRTTAQDSSQVIMPRIPPSVAFTKVGREACKQVLELDQNKQVQQPLIQRPWISDGGISG